MKILMVGHSRSGKTSYMTGLYHEYGDKSSGFGLWMSDNNKKSNLKRLGNNITRGIYPSGTDIATEYKFWLQFNDELLIPFDWYDYRGGALSESSKSSRDAEHLLKQMNSADALIVFLDGEKITSLTDDDLEDEYDILLWAIQKTIASRSSNNSYYPISFVITKGDLYYSQDILYGSPGVQYFIPVIQTIRESRNAAGMIEIVKISKNGVFNVFPPLLFSLYYGLDHYYEEWKRSYDEECARFIKYDPGVIDDFLSWLDGVPSDRELQEKSFNKLKEEESKIKKIFSKTDEMADYLMDAHHQGDIILFNPISQ